MMYLICGSFTYDIARPAWNTRNGRSVRRQASDAYIHSRCPCRVLFTPTRLGAAVHVIPRCYVPPVFHRPSGITSQASQCGRGETDRDQFKHNLRHQGNYGNLAQLRRATGIWAQRLRTSDAGTSRSLEAHTRVATGIWRTFLYGSLYPTTDDNRHASQLQRSACSVRGDVRPIHRLLLYVLPRARLPFTQKYIGDYRRAPIANSISNGMGTCDAGIVGDQVSDLCDRILASRCGERREEFVSGTRGCWGV